MLAGIGAIAAAKGRAMIRTIGFDEQMMQRSRPSSPRSGSRASSPPR
jgi:hypothetical protein